MNPIVRPRGSRPVARPRRRRARRARARRKTGHVAERDAREPPFALLPGDFAHHRFQPRRSEFVAREQHVDVRSAGGAHAGVGERRFARPRQTQPADRETDSRAPLRQRRDRPGIDAGRAITSSTSRQVCRDTEASDAAAPGASSRSTITTVTCGSRWRPLRVRAARIFGPFPGRELAIEAGQRLREHEIDVGPDVEGAVGRERARLHRTGRAQDKAQALAGMAALVLASGEYSQRLGMIGNPREHVPAVSLGRSTSPAARLACAAPNLASMSVVPAADGSLPWQSL